MHRERAEWLNYNTGDSWRVRIYEETNDVVCIIHYLQNDKWLEVLKFDQSDKSHPYYHMHILPNLKQPKTFPDIKTREDKIRLVFEELKKLSESQRIVFEEQVFMIPLDFYLNEQPVLNMIIPNGTRQTSVSISGKARIIKSPSKPRSLVPSDWEKFI